MMVISNCTGGHSVDWYTSCFICRISQAQGNQMRQDCTSPDPVQLQHADSCFFVVCRNVWVSDQELMFWSSVPGNGVVVSVSNQKLMFCSIFPGKHMLHGLALQLINHTCHVSVVYCGIVRLPRCKETVPHFLLHSLVHVFRPAEQVSKNILSCRLFLGVLWVGHMEDLRLLWWITFSIQIPALVLLRLPASIWEPALVLLRLLRVYERHIFWANSCCKPMLQGLA